MGRWKGPFPHSIVSARDAVGRSTKHRAASSAGGSPRQGILATTRPGRRKASGWAGSTGHLIRAQYGIRMEHMNVFSLPHPPSPPPLPASPSHSVFVACDDLIRFVSPH